MKSDLWTRDFDGSGKPGERCVPAADEELKSGTPAVTRPQWSLALPMMTLQRPLGSRPLDSSGRWDQIFFGYTDCCVPTSAGEMDLKSIEIV
ncbi:hypothetical protein C2S51_010687 [Perilla frutescens var. frutescens]|nr:hypothetical protein C2S51_010687 [Perilla frutescens var. frutescens]